MLEEFARTIIARVNLMERRSLRNAVSLPFLAGALYLFSPGLHAQDKCNVEVKLLLDSGETQDAVVALRFKKETASHIYFFDTEALELFSQGVIIRLRRGAQSELTVKLRPPQGKKLSPPSETRDGFKCEVDQTGEDAATSYSIRRRYISEDLPQTG